MSRIISRTEAHSPLRCSLARRLHPLFGVVAVAVIFCVTLPGVAGAQPVSPNAPAPAVPMESLPGLAPRIAATNQPLSRLRHPLPLRGGEGKGEEAVSTTSSFMGRPAVLKAETYRHYIDTFNLSDNQLYTQHIPNAAAWDFLKHNMPLLDCPDGDIEEIY